MVGILIILYAIILGVLISLCIFAIAAAISVKSITGQWPHQSKYSLKIFNFLINKK